MSPVARYAELRSVEEVDVDINHHRVTLDKTELHRVELDRNNITVTLPATDLSCPTLLVRASTVAAEDWHPVHPDVEVRKKLITIPEADMVKARKDGHLPTHLTPEDIKALHCTFLAAFWRGRWRRYGQPSDALWRCNQAHAQHGIARTGSAHLASSRTEPSGRLFQDRQSVERHGAHGGGSCRGFRRHRNPCCAGRGVRHLTIWGNILRMMIAWQSGMTCSKAASKSVGISDTGSPWRQAIRWGVLEQAGGLVRRFIRAFLDPIGWDDVLHAHDIVSDTLDQGLLKLADFGGEIKIASDICFHDLNERVDKPLMGAIAKISPHDLARRSPVERPSEAMEMIEWLNGQLVAHSWLGKPPITALPWPPKSGADEFEILPKSIFGSQARRA